MDGFFFSVYQIAQLKGDKDEERGVRMETTDEEYNPHNCSMLNCGAQSLIGFCSVRGGSYLEINLWGCVLYISVAKKLEFPSYFLMGQDLRGHLHSMQE